MKFIFKAKDQEGKIKEGKIEAVDRERAIQVLQKENLVPTFISEERGTSNITRELERIWEGVSKRELMVFFRELATLIGAKVPLVSSLRAIQEQVGNKYLMTITNEVADDVEDGMALSESLARHPNVFNTLTISMIRSGEVSGNLQKSIFFVADNIEKNYRLTSKIKGALFYPIFVIGAALIIGFLATTFILPRIADMIEDMDVPVPWYTTLVVGVGNFMESYWWAVLIVIIAAIGGFIYYVNTEAGRKEWDRMQLRIPILGRLFQYIYITRFARNFSILLAGGIPIIRALMVVGEVVDNSAYRAVILRSADEVKAGGSISTVFSRSEIIPPIVSKMIKIGEETGKTSEISKNIADFYEGEVNDMTQNLATMIEPILIVFLGIGVTILVFAVLIPIYDIANKIV